MAKLLVLHGPNLNLLGKREPEHYGTATLDDINEQVARLAADSGCQLVAKQSNAEHELVQFIHAAVADGIDYMIINPAAFTHTSIALRDAILGSGIPFIEVHLSNVFKREEFRHKSYFSDIAAGVISGLGPQGYVAAVTAAINFLQTLSNNE